MPRDAIADEDIDALISRVAEAAAASIRGDIRRYISLIERAEDYTLLPSFGGDLCRRRARGPRRPERQHGEVGDLSDQDWSLRVTLVFRRDGSNRQLVHRHADPLVHSITHQPLAALASSSDTDR